MKKWLKRIRGAVGMGLTWATAWAVVGAIFGLVMGVVLGGVPLGVVVARYVGMFAALGFFGGAIFSTVLRITEGRHRFDELSLPRFAAWGALGGLLLGVLAVTAGMLGPSLTLLDGGVVTLLGAGSAAGSLALARRAHDRDLVEAGEGLSLPEGETPDPST